MIITSYIYVLIYKCANLGDTVVAPYLTHFYGHDEPVVFADFSRIQFL